MGMDSIEYYKSIVWQIGLDIFIIEVDIKVSERQRGI
jgi:hypothetical protein